MKVKHKVSGQEFEVSGDYFERNSDRLQVLEKVSESKPKRTAKKKTKVVTEDTEVELPEATEATES
jgi:hypothetical protein